MARYRTRLDDAPPPAAPLADDAWPGALGDEARYPDWLALFERELADRPAAAVVGEWVPRLLPGTVGAATHGLIRTGARPARPRRSRDAAPPARAGVGPRLLGLVLPGAAGPAAPHRPPARARGPGRAALPSRGRPAPAAHQRHGGPGDRHRRRVRTGCVLARRRRRLHRAAGPAGLRRCPGLPAQRGRGRGHRPAPFGHLAPGLPSSSCPGSRQGIDDAALGYAWQAVAALHVAYALDRHGPGPPGAPRRSRPWWTWRSPRGTSTPSS